MSIAAVDYDYYTTVYEGWQIPREQFGFYAKKAAAYLSRMTFRKAADLWEDALCLACCAVADAYFENKSGGGLASERSGDYSVSYVAGVSKSKTEDQRLYAAASLYLADTGLLYRGVEA